MVQKGLEGFFEHYLDKESLFLDKKVLQSSYTPNDIPHRDEQIQRIAEILAPCLKLERPSNLFIYGQTGTGKTVCVRYTTSKIAEIAKTRNIPLKVVYLNCKLKKISDTEYRMIAELARELGKTIPPTGLPTDEVYKIFYDSLDSQKQLIIIILDEIDQLVKKTGDNTLYNLIRINSDLKQAQVSVIGISNDLQFTEMLDPRIKSSLSEEEEQFPPYNALQIKDILTHRKDLAFKQGIIGPGVIEKCAAYAAREHGDARRALELLRVAGEIAERKNLKQVCTEHIDEAEDKIDRDRILEAVKTLPKQIQAVLYSILSTCDQKKGTILTGDVYDYYKELCEKTSLRPLTQRRVSDVIAELDMQGIIHAKVVSKGRYGRTREISLAVPNSTIPKMVEILKQDLDLH